MKFKIRRPTIKDYKGLAQMYRAFELYNKENDPKAEVNSLKLNEKYAKEEIKTKQRVLYIAESTLDKEIIGYISFFMIKQTKDLFLEDLYVSQKFRKLGVGKQLFKEFLRAGKNAATMSIQVYNWNKQALSFYKSAGFEIDSGFTTLVKYK